jgi:hypothetical protein
MRSPTRTLLDANVLYSNHLRNLLLQLAQNDLFDAKWSAIIEDEWLRNMEPRTRERIESAQGPPQGQAGQGLDRRHPGR